MSDTERFNWKKKRHWKPFMWRFYYNMFRPKKYDKLSLWDDYLSDEYIARVDKELNIIGR